MALRYYFCGVLIFCSVLYISGCPIPKSSVSRQPSWLWWIYSSIMSWYSVNGVSRNGVGGAALASVCAEISATFFFIGYTLVKLPLKTYSLFYFHKLEGWLMKSVLKLAFSTMIQKVTFFRDMVYFLRSGRTYGRDTDCGVGIVRCLYARYDPRICFRATANTLTSRLIGEGETKRSDADCLQNDRTRADRHSAGTLMLFVYPSYGAVYLHNDLVLADASIPSLLVICCASIAMSFGIPLFEAVSKVQVIRPMRWYWNLSYWSPTPFLSGFSLLTYPPA